MRYLTLSSWLVISLNSLKLTTTTFLAKLDNNLFVRRAYPDKLILSKFKYYPCNGKIIVSLKFNNNDTFLEGRVLHWNYLKWNFIQSSNSRAINIGANIQLDMNV